MAHTAPHARWDTIRRLLLEHEQSFSDSLDRLSLLEAENIRLRDELANAVLGQARAEADVASQGDEAARLRTEIDTMRATQERLQAEIRRLNMRRNVNGQLASGGGVTIRGQAQAPTPTDTTGANLPLRPSSDTASTSGASSAASTRPARHANNQKVYCTYWIRNGECSFVQGGCMYKHEMPADKEGLRRVFGTDRWPSWWVRRQGELGVEAGGEKGKGVGKGEKERGGKRRKRES